MGPHIEKKVASKKQQRLCCRKISWGRQAGLLEINNEATWSRKRGVKENRVQMIQSRPKIKK